MDIESDSSRSYQNKSLIDNNVEYINFSKKTLNPYQNSPNVTYHLQQNQSKKKKKKLPPLQNIHGQDGPQQSCSSDDTNNPFYRSAVNDNMSMTSSRNSIMLKSNHNGTYQEESERIKILRDKSLDYFQQVIVKDIKQSTTVPENRKQEIVELYRALCVFSPTNVLFYKRLTKHQAQFGLCHGEKQKNIYPEPDQNLPRLKQLLQGHLKVGPGIQNIRNFYNNKDIIKDQYTTLLQAMLRVIFCKVRDYIIQIYPKLSWLLQTIRQGTARFNYSNAVSISLLHADKQFSPQMIVCYKKIAKVVFYFEGIQNIYLEQVQALFQLLRERNEQHLVPMRLEQNLKPRRAQARRCKPMWTGYVPYVPYAQPEFDVDFKVPKPTGMQLFETCDNYTTRNWSSKFERYVLALFMQHQNFLDLKQIINSQFEDALGKQLDLEQLRVKFQIAMKKLIIYLQLQLYYIIRRTNIGNLQNYKLNFATKKFLTLNKNEKRTLFSSQNAKNCRMFIIDYYLNNYQRKTKSYKMSAINYRLSYLGMTIDAIMAFLQTKVGECGILPQSDLEKQDTYPLNLVNNAYFSVLKSVLKEFLVQKSHRTDDYGQKMIKNPNTKKSRFNVVQVQKLFEDLKPDDLMQIQELYQIQRNKSLIVKRNPRMFMNMKINTSLQSIFVHQDWDKLVTIVQRRGGHDSFDEQEEYHGNEKFQIAQGMDVGFDEMLNMQRDVRSNKSIKQSHQSRQGNKNGLSQSENQNRQQQKLQEQQLKRDKQQFMRALKESTFIKTEMIILKVNKQKDNFRKYFK